MGCLQRKETPKDLHEGFCLVLRSPYWGSVCVCVCGRGGGGEGADRSAGDHLTGEGVGAGRSTGDHLTGGGGW